MTPSLQASNSAEGRKADVICVCDLVFKVSCHSLSVYCRYEAVISRGYDR